MATGRIAIMGGAFDPIHYAHLLSAEEAANAMQLDEVLFIPNNQPPIPKHDVVSPSDRAEMVRLAIAGNPLFKLSTIEIDREGPSYSYDTVRAIRAARPSIERLFFIVGADAVLTMPNWYRIDDLARECEFIVTTRPGFDRDALLGQLPAALETRVHPLTIPHVDLASTVLRERIADGRGVRYLTPDAVVGYIQEKGLYRTLAPPNDYANSRSHTRPSGIHAPS
ncbi:MAG: nicotinate-nucleotide adenylyltransferase [Capsulimonadaceae bacterium]|nr:nicotinate-nucleotide adenylyltransferase [Capsulimonadaceae bacterium]